MFDDKKTLTILAVFFAIVLGVAVFYLTADDSKDDIVLNREEQSQEDVSVENDNGTGNIVENDTIENDTSIEMREEIEELEKRIEETIRLIDPSVMDDL